ncbi:MAG: hypothetical protein ACR2KM_00905 [Gemmatimonadaceae bacterium]
MEHTHEFKRRRFLLTVALWYALFLPGALYFDIMTWQMLLVASVVAGVGWALFWKFAFKEKDSGDAA